MKLSGLTRKSSRFRSKFPTGRGRFIGGLTKEDFRSFEEDKIPQEIAYFSNEEQPFTVALVLDMSYSSTFKIEEIQQRGDGFYQPAATE